MRTTVTFNGVALTDLYNVSELKTSLLPRRIGTVTVPGMNGVMHTGTTLAERRIRLKLTAKASTQEGLQQAARALAAILNVDEPKPLAISIDGGLYYMAIPSVDSDTRRWRHHQCYDVEFRCVDPVAYGEEHTVNVPVSGTVTFEVGGTYPTMPTVNAPRVQATSGTDGTWGLSLDDGTRMRVPLPSTVTHAVTIDCQSRLVTCDGAVTMIEPASDWLVLAPGEHTVEMLGAGTATLSYVERWV